LTLLALLAFGAVLKWVLDAVLAPENLGISKEIVPFIIIPSTRIFFQTL
jgi:hypothetical protein